MKRAEFKCQAGEAEVWIYDVIGKDFWGEGISAKMFLEDLAALGEVGRLTVRINSPGGSVFDGNAIYNALVRFPASIVATVDGVAASAASVVAMAGDTITIAENAYMMIHEPQGSAYGRAEDHRKLANMLDKVNENLISAYRTKSKRSREQIAAWLDEEKWFSASEAVEAGMADEVTEALQLAACIPEGVYEKTPKGLEIQAKTPDKAESESVLHRNHAEQLLTLIGP